MKTRDAVLLYNQVETDTETEIVDLDGLDPISALMLRVDCTNGSAGNVGNFIHDIVTKVEVVDGSDVLVSLNGAQLQALEFYKTGKLPVMFPSEHPSGGQHECFNILFGRYLWDRQYMYDPKNYKNPQLKVTFNKAAIRAAGTTGFASGDNIYLSVTAKCMQEGAMPQGLLAAKDIYDFTSVTSGDKRVELPTDFVYHLLMGRFWVQQSDIDEVITDIKFTVDNDAYVMFNRKTVRLDDEALGLFGVARLKHDIYAQHQTAVRVINNKEPDCRAWMWEDTAGYIVGVQYQWSSEFKPTIFSNAGVALASPAKLTMVEEGHAPHATLPIPFGLMNEPDTWFNPVGRGKVELVLTQAVAATCQLVLEQLRPK